ncbi:acetyltransferase [Orenia marismortui]|uniref:acetyltransferase n=1 Tax=Orenia marismortui TaxID=46469 RepID=UPI0003652636|nr:acetyltransferase [Orenia marismortui]
MAKVIIFGIGQIAELAHFYLKNDSEHEVVAFTVDKEYMKEDKFHQLPVIEYEKVVDQYPPDEYKMFIPISYKKVNMIRTEKYKDAKKKGYGFISYISSKATCYASSIGENCFVLEDNVIQPFTKIGDNCILWSGNHIGHHTTIEDNCFLASHVVVSGSVTVGEYTFIGVNVTIRDNVTIGKENVIGASAIILKNTDDMAVFSPKGTEKSKVPSNRLRRI